MQRHKITILVIFFIIFKLKKQRFFIYFYEKYEAKCGLKSGRSDKK